MPDRLAAAASVHQSWKIAPADCSLIQERAVGQEPEHLLPRDDAISSDRFGYPPGSGSDFNRGSLDRQHQMLVLRAGPHHVGFRRICLGGSRIAAKHFGAGSNDHDMGAGLDPAVRPEFASWHTGRYCLHRRRLAVAWDINPTLLAGGFLWAIQAPAHSIALASPHIGSGLDGSACPGIHVHCPVPGAMSASCHQLPSR